MHRKLVSVQELVRNEEALPGGVRGGRGRPLADRAALARAFVAKAVFDLPTTRALVERLRSDPALCRICGWDLRGAVPGEATFSRAFAAFAASDLPGQLHKALLERELEGHLAGHVARDSTAIPAREKPEPKRKQAAPDPALAAEAAGESAEEAHAERDLDECAAAAAGKGKKKAGKKAREPRGAAAVNDGGGDAGGSAPGLQRGDEAQREGAPAELGGPRVPSGCDRRGDSGERRADLGLGA